MIIPVILSGGSGTRLWPLSRTNHPKQFLSLINNTSLFQDTILRLPNTMADPIIVCNEEHRFLVAEQLRQINKKSHSIILEPTGKNTAPAISLAAIRSKYNNNDSILFVLSSDHVIKDHDEFHKSIKIAENAAKNNKLVTFGVEPTSAETGFGYIQVAKNLVDDYYPIKSFKEKPSVALAKKYYDEGNFYWNSGMFMFKASVFIDELSKFEPDIMEICINSCKIENKDMDFIRLNKNEFLQCPSKSIDYAIMEKSQKGVMIPLNSKWNDVGSWASLWAEDNKDNNGNVIKGDVLIDQSQESYIYSSQKLITAIGVSNLIVVDTPDALLIANKENSQDIKNIVEKLINIKRHEIENHLKVFRPWGYYDSIDKGEGFQVKRISVNPYSQLSLQKHKFRSEHWVVVKGIAHVTCGNKKFTIKENQSTYIPQGVVHRLKNNEPTALEIIEIQTGEYLGEDDITRLEDDYERK
jgi:mannose-1-phosphate guanylyltransferase